jgi:hypothetical protein
MGFRSPCGYDVSFVVIPIGIDDRDLDAAYESDRVDADFPVVKTIVDPFDRRGVENPDGICEPDRMVTDVRNVLVRIPGEPHGAYLRAQATRLNSPR